MERFHWSTSIDCDITKSQDSHSSEKFSRALLYDKVSEETSKVLPFKRSVNHPLCIQTLHSNGICLKRAKKVRKAIIRHRYFRRTYSPVLSNVCCFFQSAKCYQSAPVRYQAKLPKGKTQTRHTKVLFCDRLRPQRILSNARVLLTFWSWIFRDLTSPQNISSLSNKLVSRYFK